SRPAEEKRQAAEKALQQLEEGSSGGEKGAEGKPQGGGTAPGEQATGASEELRNEARAELGKAAGRQGGSGTEGESGEERRSQEKGREDAQPEGGLEGPEQPKGAAEREGTGEGNRPGPGEGKSRDARAEGDADSGRDDTSPPRDESAGEEARRPETGIGTSGASGKPQASDDSEPAERYYEPGEGPDGWKIVDGRYVRVRIPEESDAVDVERVRKPGRIQTETAFGNAPLPPAGRPGEIRDTQPLPLEYRNILRGEGGGDR
ncbi:MAG: hypothetical protein ACREQY_13095, partial [Candidatus Binatia bacterium]